MWVPLSVMQYCHHSALASSVGDVCSSVSHAILPSLCLSIWCGWCSFLCQSCNFAITLPMHEVWVVWVMSCSSISHAILSSLCLRTRCGWCVFLCQSCNIAITLPKYEVWVMCVPLSVMRYCHHSALVWGVVDVCSSVSHAILPSLCLSMRCGWCVFLCQSCNIAITLP